MRNFNQNIQVKNFELNLLDLSPTHIANMIQSNSFYSVIYRHNFAERTDKLLIGLSVTPHSDETHGVQIKMFSHSTFNSEPKLSFQELTSIFEKSILVLNQALISKLQEFHISLPLLDWKKELLLYELSGQHHREYQNA
jgi:hypothetical protein